jgi:hypothetical protein
MGQFAGPISAGWFNPTTGRTTAAEKSPLPNRGTHDFHSPGDNGTKTNDWLLILTSH